MSYPTHCPGCGNRCPLDAPSCTTGENYARSIRRKKPEQTPVQPAEKKTALSPKAVKQPAQKNQKSKQSSVSADTLPLDEQLALAFRSAERTLAKNKPKEKSGQSRLLKLLAEHGDLTQRELADFMGIRSSSLSELLQKLEQAGLVVRTQCPEDRRTARVGLTKQGASQAALLPHSSDLFQKLSTEEKAALLNLLKKLQ